jgi:large subunit ribosomal protein L33
MASDAIKIILRSTESRYFYTKMKNKRNKEKIKLKKYDPVVKAHVEFVEEKMR